MYLNEDHLSQRAYYLSLNAEERAIMLQMYQAAGQYCWHLQARDKQLAIYPSGKTLINAARGFGKSKSVLEYIVYSIVFFGARSIVVVGETSTKVTDIILEGSDGLLALFDRYRIKYDRRRNKITIPSYGCTIVGYSGDTPERLRGFNADLVVVDELCAFSYAEETLLQCELICRKGNSKLLIATTPKPYNWYKTLYNSADIQLITGTTAENTSLSLSYTQALIRRYGANSNVLLQELEGKIIDSVPGALWSYADIAAITQALPETSPDRIIVSLDPSTGVKGGDEFGIIVLHKYGEKVYAVGDYTGLHTPNEAANIIKNIECDTILLEGSGQQLFFKNILEQHNVSAKIAVVHPKTSKLTRAEGVKIAGDNGEFFLDRDGDFYKLHDEMRSYNGNGDSPNRLDALSQGYRYLADSKVTHFAFASKKYSKGKGRY